MLSDYVDVSTLMAAMSLIGRDTAQYEVTWLLRNAPSADDACLARKLSKIFGRFTQRYNQTSAIRLKVHLPSY